MTTLLAIDPSLSATGVAYFTSDAEGVLRLDYAELIRGLAGEAMAKRCRRVTADIWRSHFVRGLAAPHEVLIEMPRIHLATRGGKADPADIIKLAMLCGAIGHDYPQSEVAFIEPAEWKGQTPKDVTTRRTRENLTAAELDRVILPPAASLAHNVWDAVGIGLWAAGR